MCLRCVVIAGTREGLVSPRSSSVNSLLRFYLHKNTEFQNFYNKIVQVLNTTAIVSGYAGRDPQGGTRDGSFLVSSLLCYKEWLKFFF